MNYDQLALDLHKKHRGKISTSLRHDGKITKTELSAYYTPGVAAISQAIAKNPALKTDFCWTNNLVAVISDGSAVLGLGNIGGHAALPVMEGKALLFKHFANIDSVPIVLDVHSVAEIVATIKAIAPSFGAINLEDIAAPQCFEIEEQLKQQLDIPVFHDDQHGTAIVVLAGLINACRLTNRDLNHTKIVVSGAGAAGTAIIKLIKLFAPDCQILVVDSQGIISSQRTDLNTEKQQLSQITNPKQLTGNLADALDQADIFIGVSKGNLLQPAHIKAMKPDPIIFALANPDPEIMPAIAKQAGAAIVATGRSDFANQINNALVFPGIFRGALDNKVQKITDQHKIAVARAVADLVEEPNPEQIIPSVFDERLVPAIAKVIV